ncbi:Mor transcription activator family protein [Kerstersia gyiorum]|uniref:Mor transcription activator family protein n=1 Tax=Kerstersia gyiorum TaxID=206506 RepID=UPI0039EB143B
MNSHSFRSKGPELLQDLADKVKVVLTNYGDIQDDVAEALGVEVAEVMAKSWGGMNIYVPLGIVVRRHRKALEIWQDFKGDNVDEVARKHGVSTQWVYKVIKVMRAEELARRQPGLFDAVSAGDHDSK